MTTEVWKFTRESNNVFVGPLTLTVTADGDPVTPDSVKFAVLPRGTRPAVADWADPVDNPDTGTGGVGVTLPAVTAAGSYGWWVQVTSGEAVEVLDPPAVAWIKRT